MNIWSDVDRASDPQAAVDWQQKMAEWPFCRAYKARTIELLELEQGDRVLDLGCGPGADLMPLAHAVGAAGKVFGVDCSERMVERAQHSHREHANITITKGDAHDLRFSSDYFDACRADRLFQHLSHPIKALKELLRVTKSGGRIAIVDPDQSTLEIGVDAGHITERIANYRKGHAANPTIASEIGGMLATLAPVSTHTEQYTLVLTNPEDAFGLLEWPQMLRAEGKLTDEEISIWQSELQHTIERGSFFYRVTFLITCAKL